MTLERRFTLIGTSGSGIRGGRMSPVVTSA
jgi:hypothetical protein